MSVKFVLEVDQKSIDAYLADVPLHKRAAAKAIVDKSIAEAKALTARANKESKPPYETTHTTIWGMKKER